MAIRAGDLRDRIAFERRQTGKDGYGQALGGYEDAGSCWAQVIYGRGDERRAAAQQGGQQPASFIVRKTPATAAIGVADRIQFQGAWDIRARAETQSRDGFQFDAVRAS